MTRITVIGGTCYTGSNIVAEAAGRGFEDPMPGRISGADFATAIIDEIESPRHHRVHFSVMS